MDWLLGDLQGCVRALEHFVAQSRFDPAKDQLWCLGDLINKGPHSLETMRLLYDLNGHAVLGNHELYALSCWQGRIKRRTDTLGALLESSEGQDYLERLLHAPLLANLGQKEGRQVWMVHGGIHPQWSHCLPKIQEELNQSQLGSLDRLLSDKAWFATHVRCCTPEGEMSKFFGHPRDCPAPFLPWDEFYEGEDLIVHGHWSMRGHYRGPKSIGLDGGYVYGRSLWAYCVQEDRVLEVRNPAGA